MEPLHSIWIIRLKSTIISKNLSVSLIDGSWRNFGTGIKGHDVVSLVAYLAGIEKAEAEAAIRQMLGRGQSEASDEA